MKQYCRYCQHASLTQFEDCYCCIKDSVIAKAQAIRPNKCKNFYLNEIDVFDLNKTYRPRKNSNEVKNFVQIKLREVKNNGSDKSKQN